MSDERPYTDKSRKKTIILWNQENDTAEITTYDEKQLRKLQKAARERPDLYQLVERNQYGGEAYIFPKYLLHMTFAMPPSEELHNQLIERAKRCFGHTE